MDLAAKTQAIEAALAEARMQAARWMQKVVGLEAQLALCQELAAEAAPPADPPA